MVFEPFLPVQDAKKRILKFLDLVLRADVGEGF
jgi:hypothetical protein